MTREEIEKYLQPGCKVKFNSGEEIHTVTDYLPSISSIYLNGYSCSFGIVNIKEILSWPVPKYFKEEHLGHWIKIKDAKDVQFPGNYKNKCGTWQKITEVTTCGDVRILGRSIIVDKEVIEEYKPIGQWNTPTHFTEEHIGHYVRQPNCKKWKQIGRNLEDCRPTEDKFTLHEANRYEIAEYRPLPPELQPKPLLLKDCPVFSFVRLKTKPGVHSPWNCIVSKSSREIIVSQDGGEGSPDPESEVLELINQLEDIPSHAMIRARYSAKFIPITEFQGKFTDITAIITESANNKSKLIVVKYLKPGDFFRIKNQKVWNKLILPRPIINKLMVKRNGQDHEISLDSYADRVITQWSDIPVNTYVKMHGNWYRHGVTGLLNVTFSDIEDISDTKPEEMNAVVPVNDYQFAKIKSGWWVKIAPEEYVRPKLIPSLVYGQDSYPNDKLRDCGTWQQVFSKGSVDIRIIGTDGWIWHKDFIVSISENKPIELINCPVTNTKEEADPILAAGGGVATHMNACKEVPLTFSEPLQFTCYEASHMSWSEMNDLATRIPCGEIPFNFIAPEPGTYEVSSKLGESCRLTLPKGWIINLPETKQEKIMLNTVEEIKKLDEANLKEAAKKVKEERDNDQVKAAREKLTHLLNCESDLKARKEKIDKELAEMQELIKAFGYPPPTSTK